VVSFKLRPLYPRCSFDRILGGPQSQSGRRGDPARNETPAVQHVARRYTDFIRMLNISGY
jgi:hypothetical protein